MQQTPEQFKNKIEAMVLPLAQKLGTRNGFFEYWFSILPKCKTQKAAFDIAYAPQKDFGVEAIEELKNKALEKLLFFNKASIDLINLWLLNKLIFITSKKSSLL